MNKLIKVDDFYYQVDHEEGDSYICFPLGGGFRHRIPKSAAEPCAYESSWAPGLVSIDADGAGWFQCMMDHNMYWNGWRDPYFEKPEMLRFLEVEGFTIAEETEDCIQFYYQGEDEAEPQEVNRYEANKHDIDGQEYWNISGWCFVSKEDCGPEEATG